MYAVNIGNNVCDVYEKKCAMNVRENVRRERGALSEKESLLKIT